MQRWSGHVILSWRAREAGAARISAARNQREPESSGWGGRSWCRGSNTDATSLVCQRYSHGSRVGDSTSRQRSNSDAPRVVTLEPRFSLFIGSRRVCYVKWQGSRAKTSYHKPTDNFIPCALALSHGKLVCFHKCQLRSLPNLCFQTNLPCPVTHRTLLVQPPMASVDCEAEHLCQWIPSISCRYLALRSFIAVSS